MAPYLSPAWINELHAALSTDEAVRRATADVALTVQQVVTGGPDGDLTWHVVVDHGDVAVRPGTVDGADVTFRQDHDTALAVAAGESSAQAAFMIGRLTVTGDVAKLIEHQGAFTGLDAATDAVRAAATLDTPTT
jgi:putative sterol carrier protein